MLISRAANTAGTHTPISGAVTIEDVVKNTVNTFNLLGESTIKVRDLISFGADDNFYYVKTSTFSAGETIVVLDRNIETDVAEGTAVNSFKASMNGVFEGLKSSSSAVINSSDYYGKYLVIENSDEYEMKETSIAFTHNDSKIKIISKNPGKWSDKLEIAIANPTDFGTAKKAFDGISLDDLFEYRPTGTEVGIIIKYEDEIKEIFTVDFDSSARDINGKSAYIETVINNQSSYIFIKDNADIAGSLKSYIFSSVAGTIKLVNGRDSDIQADDLITALEVFSNKEELEIDCIIGNELDSGASAKELADSRKD